MAQLVLARWLSGLSSRAHRWPSPEQFIQRTRAKAEALRAASHAELQATKLRLQPLCREPDRSPDWWCDAFAAVLEAVRRLIGVDLYDVQILAGLAIARGEIAQMQTGEGKTLAAAMPAFVHALAGRGVHVVTPNSYLAARDFEMLAPVFRSLDCSAGLLPENASTPQKRAAYACDVTYGTGYEFGFDYLREQTALLARRRAPLGDGYWKLLQGKPKEAQPLGARRGFALIDEIDSVLIDEACTPLVLSDSGQAEAISAAPYEYALGVAQRLVAGRDFVMEGPHANRLRLTDAGQQRCYQALAGEAHRVITGPWSDQIRQALVVLHVLRRDVDYVVTSGKVVFVDGATGRLSPDRAWRDGLQQFLEVKEGLPLSAARSTAARMTRQSFFTLYDKLGGMTATATQSEAEFRGTYRLRVVDIPPRLPPRRVVLPDRVFVDNRSRLRAVETQIDQLHQTGRPILVGCRTIERSEQIAARLTDAKIAHELLNGKQTAAEADVIARAGRRGAVTIATNMAGRGTDIKLEMGVAEIGGMHLIAVERNESPRIDRQLMGRVARQGDPGSCQFFVAADDPLLERFAPKLAGRIRQLPHDQGEVRGDFSEMIRAAQGRAEAAGRSVRKELAAADTWLRNELRLS